MEMRYKIMEEKKNRLKPYKKMVKLSTYMVCIHCQKTIATNVFQLHLHSCSPSMLNTKKNKKKSQLPSE